MLGSVLQIACGTLARPRVRIRVGVRVGVRVIISEAVPKARIPA